MEVCDFGSYDDNDLVRRVLISLEVASVVLESTRIVFISSHFNLVGMTRIHWSEWSDSMLS